MHVRYKLMPNLYTLDALAQGFSSMLVPRNPPPPIERLGLAYNMFGANGGVQQAALMEDVQPT